MPSGKNANAGTNQDEGLPWPLITLGILLMLADGMDLAALPLVVPYAAKEIGVPASSFGFALSSMALGFGLGGLLIGPLGDRIGRRPLVIGLMLLTSLATAATAYASGLAGFVICRLVVGIGLGGCLTNLNALVAELAPPNYRVRTLAAMATGIPLGAAGIGLLMPSLLNLTGGWRGTLLVLGAVQLAATTLCGVWLPESPTLRAQSPLAAKRPARTALASLLLPFGPAHRMTTFVYVMLCTLNSCALYLLQSWLPTVLPQVGYSLADASRLTGISQLGGLAGGFAIATFLDRSAAVPALGCCYALVLASLIGFQFLPPGGPAWLLLLVTVLGGFAGAHTAMLALGAVSYPPAMTAAALGLAAAMARAGAIGGPLFGQWLLEHGFTAPRFFLAAFPIGAFCLGLVFLIPRMRRV